MFSRLREALAPLWVSIRFHSRLPAPRADWTEKNMKAAICFLPVIGLPIGVLLWLWWLVCDLWAVGPTLFASVAALIPAAVTGGLHMDGFMDVSDALSSHQTRERKLEIMKDSHIGAFAAICIAAYLLLSFGFFASIGEAAVLPICAGFVLSRSLCAFSALTLPNARKGGLLCAFTEHAQTVGARIAMAVTSVLCAGVMVFLNVKTGGCAALAGFAALLWYWRFAQKQFGGVTGDTCGFFTQICELSILAGALIGGYL